MKSPDIDNPSSNHKNEQSTPPSNSNNLKERKKESYKIFDDIAGTYDFLNKLLSFGIDSLWRRKLKKHLPPRRNLEVLDLATGTADVALTLSSDSRIQHIHGLDLSHEMIKKGREKVQRANLRGMITLDLGDGVEIPAKEQSFDVVTISFGIRNFSDPQKSLNNVYKILRPGGRLLVTEFSLPRHPLIRKLYFFYFRKLLPKVGNFFSRHPDAYSYLNQSVEDFPYGEDFLQMMRNAGFQKERYHELTFGIASLYIGEKDSDEQ